MNVLIVGYGSIGKRHYTLLQHVDTITSIDIVTKQELPEKATYKDLQDVTDLSSYDYFVIATETSKHFEQLKFLCSKVVDKLILVEKPIFDKNRPQLICSNFVAVAYNLRFHPLLQKLKELLSHEDVYYANIVAGQYLPTWRPEQDYRDSYSAKLSLGGGVLRDLSHELDYINWLFGDFTIVESINTHISNLEIEADDIFTALAKTSKGTIINVTMDYISKMPMRRLTIHTKHKTIEASFITNTIDLYDLNGIKETIECDKIDRDYTYMAMHNSVLTQNRDFLCSYEDGLKVMEQIGSVQFKRIS